jgi:hypothetical protein
MTLDAAALHDVSGGAPKPLRGEMGDLDFCNALDTRWMAYRELGMRRQHRPAEARADRCWAAFIKKLDVAVPRR